MDVTRLGPGIRIGALFVSRHDPWHWLESFRRPGYFLRVFVLKNAANRRFVVHDLGASLESLQSGQRYRQTVIDMVEKLGIDSFSDRPVDAHLVARDWWLENDARLLPGEVDAVTVFEILYQDGCRYFGFTGASVFERLVELSNGLVDVRSNGFVSEHCRQMSYVVRCVASNLDRGGARELRELLVAEAPDGGLRIDGTTVMSPACWLKEGDDGVEVSSFAEWAKTMSGGFNEGNPEYR